MRGLKGLMCENVGMRGIKKGGRRYEEVMERKMIGKN